MQKLVAHQVKLAETAAAKAVAAAEGDREYDQAKARWMVEKAEAAKLLRQSRDGELVPADEVQSSWDALVINARTILLAIPSRVAAIWSTIKSPADAERIIREFIEQALSQLAAAEFVLEDDNANGNGASPASLS